ncbi:hypothetical protein D9758_003097 [Tetrapyrgos nigripes]|uniref:F-box domain-containing protein n=1 Tax=Tetrapyrgos nigripes TaxID=182062 RepID=A0A8H5GQT2_9AGAR|nr:hypothetical protein D9758_003097 [Tetrapyrgos nigripes]
MPVTELLDLPMEILQEIVFDLETGFHRKPLRSTCRALGSVVEPVLFSNIVIKTHDSYLARTILFCKTLSDPGDGKDRNSLGTHVKTLTVHDWTSSTAVVMIGRDNVSQGLLNAWREAFICAVSSLVNLDSFHWIILQHNTREWMYTQVPEILSKLPRLSQFTRVYAKGCPLVPLNHLRHLSTLAVDARHIPHEAFDAKILEPLSIALKNNRDLQILRVTPPVSRDSKAHSFLDLFRGSLNAEGPSLKLKTLVVEDLDMQVPVAIAPHLQHLTNLEIRLSWHAINIGNFWDVLRTAKVSLESLVVDCDIDHTLIDYLSQCHSRPNILQLKGTTGKLTDAESDELADRFFATVLPKFAGALRQLTIRPYFEGRWCIGPHNLNTISRCTNVETLSVCLNGEVISSLGDQVNCAHSLPRLKCLYLDSCYPTWARDGWCGTGRSRYADDVKRTILEFLANLDVPETLADADLRIYFLRYYYIVCRTQDGSLGYKRVRVPN